MLRSVRGVSLVDAAHSRRRLGEKDAEEEGLAFGNWQWALAVTYRHPRSGTPPLRNMAHEYALPCSREGGGASSFSRAAQVVGLFDFFFASTRSHPSLRRTTATYYIPSYLVSSRVVSKQKYRALSQNRPSSLTRFEHGSRAAAWLISPAAGHCDILRHSNCRCNKQA